MKKIVIITGLTASGKSGLAIKIAKEFNGEIISADSVQIYKGLNIGSAKDTISARQGIEHYLIDIKNPTETYNVGDFINDCKNAINTIINKGKTPIIVGGTGLYIKALLEGYSLGGAEGNETFREHYQQMANKHGNEIVWKELYAINPTKAETVHFNNLKRVIRYLEIEKFGSNVKKTETILKDFEVYAVGITADREEIYSKINNRVDKMISEGLEEEVKSLVGMGITKDMQSVTSIGYREWFDYLENKIDKATLIDLIKQHTRNYAKRQLTFMKTINGLKLLNIEEAELEIRRFLNDRIN